VIKAKFVLEMIAVLIAGLRGIRENCLPLKLLTEKIIVRRVIARAIVIPLFYRVIKLIHWPELLSL